MFLVIVIHHVSSDIYKIGVNSGVFGVKKIFEKLKKVLDKLIY